MRHNRKKLLVAAIGVAAMNYACQDKPPIQTGNLMAPEVRPDAGPVMPENKPDAEPLIMSGNLMAPPPPPTTTSTAVGPDHKLRTGNLMPPPPPPPTQGTAKPVPVPKK